MYHPPRGGVRGGADQFNWEDVKSDKHRENYLGHSVKAPVGRWQKGRDLLWYSKDRSADKADMKKTDTSEISAIKKIEEEAMLAALGQKVVRKVMQPLSKEEVTEVLKRNTTERDASNVERVEGVGVMSARAAMLINTKNQKGSKPEGICFETPASDEKNASTFSGSRKHTRSHERKGSSKKSSKKHKKEKKHKKKKYKLHSPRSDNISEDENEASSEKRINTNKHFDEVNRKKYSKYDSKVNERHSQKSQKQPYEEIQTDKKCRTRKRHDSSSECESDQEILSSLHKPALNSKRRRHDSTSSSD